MFSTFKKVLVLAPHTDDGELGVGGTICKFIESGADVFYVAFSTAEESVPEGYPRDILKKEVKKATKILGIKDSNLILYDYRVRNLNYRRQDILQNLIDIRNSINPEIVFMPSLNDIHQDHQTIAQEGLRAFKTRTLLGYELMWNNLTFNTDVFIKLEKSQVKKKAESLKQYSSQSHRDYTDESFIFSLASCRGVQIGSKYAEAFELIRWVI